MAANVGNAVRGAVIGATFGAPFRGAASFRAINYYEPIPARMAAVEALDAWLVYAQMRKEHAPPEQTGEVLTRHWSSNTAESAFGMANLAAGFRPPFSGSFRNPLPGGSQAFGRAVFWGLAYPSDLDKACEAAFYDASIDHAGDGVWCAVAVAAMASQAGLGLSIPNLLRVAAGVLPKASLALGALTSLLVIHSGSGDAQAAYSTLPSAVPTQDPLAAPLNFALVCLALLYGEGDFGKGIRLAAGCGGAADLNALAVGAILGAGSEELEPDWMRPLGTPYVAGFALQALAVPTTIEEFVATVAAAVCEPEKAEPLPPVEPAPTESAQASEGDGVEASPAPAVADPPAPTLPALGDRIQRLLAREANWMAARIGEAHVEVEFVDPPVLMPNRTNRLILRACNVGSEEQIVNGSLTGPSGWTVACKISSFRLRAGEESAFAAVVLASDLVGKAGSIDLPGRTIDLPRPIKKAKVDQVTLHMGLGETPETRLDIGVPLLPNQRWYQVGPFANIEGTGFDKAYKAEDVLKVGEVFNGRGDLPVSWRQTFFSGLTFDLEPMFTNGPGVVYLFGKPNLGAGQKMRIVVAASTGAVVWVNRERLTRYHDIHATIPRAIQPYVGEFTSTKPTEVLVKVLRDRTPLDAVVIYFLDETGKVVWPDGFERMD